MSLPTTVPGRFGSEGAPEISRWSSRSAAQPPENVPKKYAPWKGTGTVASAQETLVEQLAVMLFLALDMPLHFGDLN